MANTTRLGSFIYHVHIADGFADDCDELIHRCLKREPLTYQAFCYIWKEMNFASIFKGRSLGAEIAELTEELVHIAKHYMVANTSNFEESVSGVFLVYALLSLQPYAGFACIRIVPEDMPAINRIEMVARREKRYDVLYILGSLLVKGPCQFHAAQRERGMELAHRKYLEGYTGIDKHGVRPKGVFYRQNEELDIIREMNSLSRRYTEAKAAITTDNGQVDRSLNYTDQNLAADLDSSLKKIINGLIDDEEEISKPLMDHYNSIQAIKSRAMKNTVNPMKHLTGLNERTTSSTSPETKSEIKTKPGKIKTGSPSKPVITGTPTKRKATPKKILAKRQRKSVSSSSESDEELNLPSDEEMDDDWGTDSEDELNDTNIEQNQHEINIEIESLPVIIRNEKRDEYIEIEIVDQYKPLLKAKEEIKPHEDLKTKLLSLKDVSIRKVETGEVSKVFEIPPEMAEISRVDDHVFKKPTTSCKGLKIKKPEKREQKKTLVKSKFKRMGILPVANFNDTSTK